MRMNKKHDAGRTERRAGIFPRRPLSGESGITLIELLVVVTIIGVLIFAAGIEFVGWQGNYRVESQVKEMYADLMNARVRAMQRNRLHFIVVTANNYQVFDDVNENNAPDINPTERWWPNPKPFAYPALQTGTIVIDARGLVSTIPAPAAGAEAFIRFDYDTGRLRPDYDCISLGAVGTATGVNWGTRLNMGKWNGGLCVAG